jgi:hypothetical protein
MNKKDTKKIDYTDFKSMVNGPSILFSPKHKINLRSRAGSCDHWNQNTENLVALDLREHTYNADAYAFSILDMANKRQFIVGWMLFDELINKSNVVIEDETIYLTIPIKSLHDMEKDDFEKFKYSMIGGE